MLSTILVIPISINQPFNLIAGFRNSNLNEWEFKLVKLQGYFKD